MERRGKYIISPCINHLVSKGRIPMLFIGSGISKRYLKDYPSWDELIKFIANEIGVSNNQLIAMRQEITDTMPTESKGKINAEIGSRLTKIFREKVLRGEILLENIFTDEEIKRIETENITFSKMLISKRLSKYEITDNKKYLSELSELRKLQNNIGAVVTTNYDRFLEKEIFNNFDVFVEQSQYYMTECVGIGEIYKIHGSVSSPNSLIFNTEDYNNFENNLRVIAAKLLNLALEYPIIFIGYSLEDDNILSILETLVNALTKSQLDVLSQNLIYVDWKFREEKLRESKRIVSRNGKSLELTCITTDNYFVLYKHLLKFTPAEKPERVRKYKKMIHHLIEVNNSGEATIIANDNLDKLKADGKLVVAFGKREKFAKVGIIGINTDNIIKWVLEQNNSITEDEANSIFEDYYLTTRVPSGNYVPMFFIAKFTGKYNKNDKLNTMKNNLQNWIDTINADTNIPLYNDYASLENNPDNLPNYKYIRGIIKAYSKDQINYDECLKLLVALNSDQNQIKNTDFRKAVAYLDMK